MTPTSGSFRATCQTLVEGASPSNRSATPAVNTSSKRFITTQNSFSSLRNSSRSGNADEVSAKAPIETVKLKPIPWLPKEKTGSSDKVVAIGAALPDSSDEKMDIEDSPRLKAVSGVIDGTSDFVMEIESIE